MVNPRPKPPFPGGELVQMIDSGPQEVSPNATRVNLIPIGDGGPNPLSPRVTRRPKRKPALPTAEEIEALPSGARAALTLRCALRVAPLTPLRGDGNAIATTILAATAILRIAPDPREVAVIRRDFETIKRLAKENGWTDDTPVPQDVFGPLWPEGREPKWTTQRDKPRD